jgi:methylmalonyl-CoA mutase N-terminal domain/subunit
VNVTTLADMEVLFDGINLADITTSMTINSPAPMIFAMCIWSSPRSRRGLEDAPARPERHPQRVHRAEGIHLPAPIDAAHHRHLPVLLVGRCRAGTRSR